MAIARLHHSTRPGRALARVAASTVSRRGAPVLALAAACLLLGVSPGGAGSADRPAEAGKRFVEKVQAATGSDGLEVEVTTTSRVAPVFSLFSLREPDRLVVDLPDYLWKPGLTAHLPSASPAVHGVRVGQFSAKPPITRVVFDLTPPVRSLRYRAVSSTADGNLRFDLSEQPSGDKEGGKWLGVPAPGSGAGTARARTAPPGRRVGDGGRRAGEDLRALQGGAAVSEEAAAAAGAETAPAGGGTEQPQPARAERAIPMGQGLPLPSGQAGDQRAAGAQRGGPSIPLRAGPSTALRAGPSTALRAGPSTALRAGLVVRLAGAAALVVLTALFAVWARRRFQGAPSRGRTLAEASGAAKTAPTDSQPEAPAEPEGRLQVCPTVRCRVVDGYLVLAPEERSEELSGPRRVKVAEGTLDLDFGSEEVQPAGAEAAPALDVTARAADLVASLGDDSVAVRRAAAEGLLELAAGGQASALLPYLDSADPRVRSLVAGVLGDAVAVDCLAAVARLSEDPDASVRACVMYAFARFGEGAAGCADQVRARLSDPDQSVRAGAVEALAALFPRSEETAQQLLALTEDREPLVRQAGASATFAFALRGIAEPVIALLADFTRRAQALELLQQADDSVLWRLLAAARNSASTSAQAALDTLSYVMSKRWTADDFREELESPDAEARLAGLEGLAMIGGPEAVRLVRRAAEMDASPAVRKRAAEVLSTWEAWVGEAMPSPSSSEEIPTKA